MKVQSTFYPDFISKTVDILLISPFITKKCPNYWYLMHLHFKFARKMSQITHFWGVTILVWKTGSVNVWTNFMSGHNVPLPPTGSWICTKRLGQIGLKSNKMKLRSQDLHRFKSRLQPQVKPKEPQCCLQTDLHMKRQKTIINWLLASISISKYQSVSKEVFWTCCFVSAISMMFLKLMLEVTNNAEPFVPAGIWRFPN